MLHDMLSRIGRLERRPSRTLLTSAIAVYAIGLVVDAINLVSIMTAALGALAIAGIAILMGGEIVSRSFGYPLPFSWEYSAYLMSASFFLSAGFTLLSGGHVRVVLFLADPKSKLTYAAELLASVIALIVFIVVAWALVEATMQHAQRGTTSYTPMQTPMALPVGISAAGAVVLFLQGIGRVLGLIIGRTDAFVFTQAEMTEG